MLSWGHQGAPQVWDPATGDFTAVPSPSLLFCAGHAFLPDGRLLVAGGHISNDHGLPNDRHLRSGHRARGRPAPPMAQGRWYPTTTTLPDGEVLVLSGQDEAGEVATVPEVWDGSRLAPAHDREPVAAELSSSVRGARRPGLLRRGG